MWKLLISVVVVSTLLLCGVNQAAGIDITAPGDVVKGVPDDGDWPGAETPDLAVDDNVSTKYLHFKGATQTTGFVVTPSLSGMVVKGLTFTTANDAAERDPIAFELYGSNESIDGPYELIAEGDIVDFAQAAPWPRFTKNETPISFENEVAYDHYQVLFTAVRDPGSANSMQIAEVELLATLPLSWRYLDVGDAAGTGGNAYESGGTYTLTADGHDIWDNSDGFGYAYQYLNGDGEITARVTSITGPGTNTWGKAGVMIRDTLDGPSKHMMMAMTASDGGGICFQGRQSTGGGSTSYHGDITASPPHWVRITREGNTFTGYHSADGVDWELFTDTSPDGAHSNPIELEMAEVVFIGLCLTSHESGVMRSATFDNVSYVGNIYGPKKAGDPSPADGVAGAAMDSVLSWSAAVGAVSHDVYFGTESPPPFIGNQTGLSYDPGPLEGGTVYYWMIEEVDAEGTRHAGDLWSFKTTREGVGTILREVWEGIGGTSISDLTGNANFPGNPSYTDEMTLFETPTNFADNFGSRLQGWLHPETSGDYTFWIATDDAGELWLSTDDSPANAVLIAFETSWTGSRSWQEGDEKSDPVSLVGGEKYYVMAMYKEGGGGDNLAVAWQGPDSPDRDVITGYYLSPFVNLWAYGPSPANGATGVEVAPTLSWSPGVTATSHDVYFGTESPPAFIGNQTETSYAPGALELGQTYYWRVDEVTDTEVLPGNLWSFTVSEYVVVDDFEAYTVVPVDPPAEQVEVVPGYTVTPTDPDAAGLLMLWAFDGVGPQVIDGAGRGNFGFLINAARTSPGYDGTGSALECLGNGGHAAAPTAAAQLNGLDAISISIWVKSNATDTDAGFIIGEDAADADDRDMRYDVAGANGGGTNVIKMGVSSTGGLQQLESSSGAQTTEWQHLVMTWSSGNKLALYIDGVLDEPTANDAATSGTLTGYTKLLVGKGGKDIEPSQGWDGLIDDLRIYDYALSYGEVRSLAGVGDLEMPAVLGPLLAHYEFEGNYDDSSGNGYNGTPVGDISFETDEVMGQVLSLPGGDNQFVKIGEVGISGAMPRTIACWAKADHTNIPDWTLVFGFTTVGGGNGSHFNIGSLGGPGGVGAHCWGWEETIFSDEEALDWHHYAMTYDGTTIAYYGDGVLTDTDLGKSNVQNLVHEDNVHIGSRATQDSSFPGKVDDARIYNYCLSPAEVAGVAGYVSTNPLADTWTASGGAVASLVVAADQSMMVENAGEVTGTLAGADLTAGGGKALSVGFRGDPSKPGFLATNVEDALYDIGQFSGDMTYEFIVKSNPDETEASMCLIGRRQFGATQVGLKYEQWNNTGTYGATTFGVMDYDYGVATNPGVDTHLTFVSSEDSGTTALYVDGVLQGSIDSAITLSGVVGIGYGAQGADGSGSFDNFDGDIYGVAIYDVALSNDEILANSDAYFASGLEGWKAAVAPAMSVTLTDGDGQSATVAYDGDPTDLAKAEWQDWNIDLRAFTGVNAANANTMAIGLAGTNVMYFDDIRVYTGRCMPWLGKQAADFNSDCVVDEADLQVLVDLWGYQVGNQGVWREYYETWIFDNGLAGANFDAVKPTGVMPINNFDISGARPDRFGYRFTGSVIAPEDGDYTFYTSSDDGSMLYIGDTLVVDNDGWHGMQWAEGTINLTAGEHPITVTMFEDGGGEGLLVDVAGPGFDRMAIPDEVLIQSHPLPAEYDLSGDGNIDWDDLFILLDSWLDVQLWPY